MSNNTCQFWSLEYFDLLFFIIIIIYTIFVYFDSLNLILIKSKLENVINMIKYFNRIIEWHRHTFEYKKYLNKKRLLNNEWKIEEEM